MDAPSLLDRRKVALGRRQRPSGIRIHHCSADGDGDHGSDSDPPPTDLKLETTYENGKTVAWFDDRWWIETLRRWKDRPLTVHILPTPDSLLQPVVLHELEMIRRLMTPWRLVGHCYLSDVAHPPLLRRLAVNPYDEVRVVDAERPTTESFEMYPSALTLSEVFERVHDIQRSANVSKPLLTRAPDR